MMEDEEFKKLQKESLQYNIAMNKLGRQEKYYTPDITDIRIGYECEILTGKNKQKGIEVWEKHIINFDHQVHYGIYVELDHLRVPYLTKEQILAEGWECSDCDGGLQVHPDGSPINIFIKDKYVLMHIIEQRFICLETDKDESSRRNLFEGKCPSINELRYITKLLNI